MKGIMFGLIHLLTNDTWVVSIGSMLPTISQTCIPVKLIMNGKGCGYL